MYFILHSSSTLLSSGALPSAMSFSTSSPKSVFCQANQGRVKSEASSLLNDSWMNHMPASVFSKVRIHQRISSSSCDVKHFIMMLMGHTIL